MGSELTPEVLATLRKIAETKAAWDQDVQIDPPCLLALLDEIEVWRKTSQTALESSIRTSLTSEVMRASIRDAFDAGARAMRDAVLEQDDDATHAPDITKLPGRPETKENI